MSQLEAYLGALTASVFFGSNYVPTKKYPMGDGFTFNWVFANGVMVIGLISMFINGQAVFVPTGLLGGSVWALGNLCVIPIINALGLGLGMLIWSGSSLVTGFFCGKFGFFGLDQDAVAHPLLNWAGIVLIVLAMVVFFFIKPDLHKEEYKPINNEEGHTQKHGEHEREGEFNFFKNVPPKYHFVSGIVIALLAGICFGTNMVPMKLWVQSMKASGVTPSNLAFVFSHFTGIYLFNTTVFIVYNLVKRPPSVFPSAVLPAFISGAMWGVAQCGMMIATQILGFTVGFPISGTGPMIVSSLWSVLVFREIRGKRNLGLLFVSFALIVGGLVMLATSG